MIQQVKAGLKLIRDWRKSPAKKTFRTGMGRGASKCGKSDRKRPDILALSKTNDNSHYTYRRVTEGDSIRKSRGADTHKTRWQKKMCIDTACKLGEASENGSGTS